MKVKEFIKKSKHNNHGDNFFIPGLSIHTFHGNFFVRSTDLLSLPNVNPDAGYAVQMSVEESLADTQLVSFQSALLYTSSKGACVSHLFSQKIPYLSFSVFCFGDKISLCSSAVVGLELAV